jgi:putative transposase
VEVVLGVPFRYKYNDELKKLLEDFREIVNFCVDHHYLVKNDNTRKL